MGVASGPRFPGIENGLIFAIDPLNQESWAGPDSNIVNNIPPLSSTISGSIQNDTSGSYGSNESFSFDGTDDRVAGPLIGDLIDRGANTSTFSISCWVKTTTQNKGICVASAYYNNIVLEGYLTQLRFNIADGVVISAVVDYADGNWHHVAATCDLTSSGTTMRLYFDGNEIASGSGTRSTNFSNYNFNIGCKAVNYGSPAHFWNGNIGPVLIYNRALTALEASQNYNQLKSRFT